MDFAAEHASRCAVSLAWLLRFAEVDNPHIRQLRLTTAQVVQGIVVPATASRKCRFTDLLLSDAQPDQQATPVSQGRPFYFISHAWARPFVETLDMVAQHFSAEQQRMWRRPLPVLSPHEIFVWLDVFAINQHDDSAQQALDLAALQEVVDDAEETLMVLDPQGSPLTRIWCLFEAWQACRATTGAVAVDGPQQAQGPGTGPAAADVEPPSGVGPTARGKLRLLSYGIPFEQLKQVFIDLGVASAKATKDGDRTRILGAITTDARSGGLLGMTHRLKAALVAGTVAQVPSPEEAWNEEVGLRLSSAANLCALYTRVDWAEELLRRDVVGSEQALGRDNPRTLNAVTNLGALLHFAGKHAEAEVLARRALDGSECVLGADDPSTLRAVNTLATVLRSQGKLDEAEPLAQRAVEASGRVLGEDHDDTLTAVANLAELLELRGKLEEAEALYRRALGASERGLGAKHPSTLLYAHSLATLLSQRNASAGDTSGGSTQEVEQLFRRAIEGRELVLGASHPDTLSTVHNFANFLILQRRLPEAEPLCRRALDGLRHVSGSDSPDALVAANSLGRLLHAQGRLDSARQHLRHTLEGLHVTLGPEHPDTLMAAFGLIDVLLDEGDIIEAESLLWRAHAGAERALGAAHPDAVAAANKLLGLLVPQGRYADAEALYRRTLEGVEQRLGPDHEDLVPFVGSLAGLLELQGRSGEAEALARRALAAIERARHRHHHHHDHQQARYYQQGSQDGDLGSCGSGGGGDDSSGGGSGGSVSSEEDVATLRSILARALESQGRLPEAAAAYRRALGSCRRALGAGHPDTEELAARLAAVTKRAATEPGSHPHSHLHPHPRAQSYVHVHVHPHAHSHVHLHVQPHSPVHLHPHTHGAGSARGRRQSQGAASGLGAGAGAVAGAGAGAGVGVGVGAAAPYVRKGGLLALSGWGGAGPHQQQGRPGTAQPAPLSSPVPAWPPVSPPGGGVGRKDSGLVGWAHGGALPVRAGSHSPLYAGASIVPGEPAGSRPHTARPHTARTGGLPAAAAPSGLHGGWVARAPEGAAGRPVGSARWPSAGPPASLGGCGQAGGRAAGAAGGGRVEEQCCLPVVGRGLLVQHAPVANRRRG